MIAIRPASDVPWPDLERIFETPGDPRTCWCQYFKLTGAAWEAADARELAPRLHEQTRRSDPTPGLVAYVGDDPAGWVAVEPRDNYPRLRRSRVVTSGSAEQWGDASVWSVVCFVVRRDFRRQGVSARLLEAAVEHARAAGARVVEGYPVDPAGTTGSPTGSLYHGTVSMFEAAGFAEVAVPTPARRVMARVINAGA
jgi:GNAT superfamily N-acetyltransferase